MEADSRTQSLSLTRRTRTLPVRRRRRRASLSVKLAAFVGGLVVLTALATGFVTAQKYSAELIDKDLRHMELASESGRAQIHRSLGDAAAYAQSIATRDWVTAVVGEAITHSRFADVERLRQIFTDALALQPAYAGIRVYGLDGRLRLSVQADRPLVALHSELTDHPRHALLSEAVEQARIAATERVYLSRSPAPPGIGFAEDTEPLLFGAALRVRDSSGQPVAVLEVLLDLGVELQALRRDIVQGTGIDSADLLILDDHGDLLSLPTGAIAAARWQGDATPAQLASLAQQSAQPKGTRNAVMIGSGDATLAVSARYVDVPHSATRTLLLLVAPRSELLADVVAAHRRTLFVTLVIVVLAALLAVLYARHATQPLRMLASAMDDFGAGREARVQEIDSHDEVGRLARSMAGMMSQVRERQMALQLEVEERRRAEESLRESRRITLASERRYRRLYEGIIAGVCTADTAGRLQSANPTLVQMLGYATEDELLRIDVAHELYLGPGDYGSLVHRIRTQGEVHNVELRLRRKDGHAIVALASLRAVWNDAGDIQQFETTLVDITDLKSAEQAQRTSELRFRRLFDSNVVGVVFGNVTRDEIVDANSHFLSLLGLRPTELPVAISAVTPDQHAEADRRALQTLLDSGRVGPYQKEYLHTDGTRIPVLLGAALIDRERQDFVAVVLDRSAEVALEQRLRQSQKMEAVGQLTGGIAHDFNNLLSVIIGNLQLLERVIAGQERAQGPAQAALRAALRGADLTRRLLSFSRRQPLDEQLDDLRTHIDAMQELLRRSLGDEIEVRTDIAPDTWLVRIDRSQLENAILNLAINSRDAMPDGGRITLMTRNVTLDAPAALAQGNLAPGDYVLLAVDDTGCGMPPAVVAQAFEPFFTTKDVGRGSGLGLAMVYGFAKQSGGAVHLYSEVDQGTSVKIYLPRATGAQGALPASIENEVPAGGHERVLLVEDDPEVRETSRALLTGLGYQVSVAADGQEALGILARERHDLLFTDVMMPGGMRGPQLAHEAELRQPDLKVLFTSGFSESAILYRGRVVDGSRLIMKPFTQAELARKLRLVLDAPASPDAALSA